MGHASTPRWKYPTLPILIDIFCRDVKPDVYEILMVFTFVDLHVGRKYHTEPTLWGRNLCECMLCEFAIRTRWYMT